MRKLLIGLEEGRFGCAYSEVALCAGILSATGQGSTHASSDGMVAAGARNAATLSAGHDVLGLLDRLLELDRHIGGRCSDSAIRCRCRTQLGAQSSSGTTMLREKSGRVSLELFLGRRIVAMEVLSSGAWGWGPREWICLPARVSAQQRVSRAQRREQRQEGGLMERSIDSRGVIELTSDRNTVKSDS